MALKLDKIIYYLIFVFFILITTLPLIYSLDFYFPYVTPRSFAFRFLVEFQIILFLILTLKDKTYLPQMNLASFSVFFAMIVLLIANFLGENPSKSFWGNFERMDGFNGFIHLSCLFLIAQSILKTKKQWAIITHVSILIALIVSLLGVRELISEPSAFISSTLGNASYLAIYIVFHIFITSLFFFSSKNTIHKSLYAFVILFFVFIVYNTGSRGCFLALFIGLIISTIFTRDFKIIKKFIVPFMLFIAFSMSFIWLFKDYAFVKNNSTYVRIIDFNSATSTRSKLWSIAYEGIKERPLLGWGQENFELVFDKYYKTSLGDAEDWFDRVHNSFLDWTISGGLFGGLAYILLFALPLYLVWKSNENKMSKSIILGMIGAYLVYSTFMFDHLTSQLFYFFTLAYISTFAGSNQKNVSQLGSQLTVILFALFLSYTAIFINFPAYKSAKVLGQLLYTNDLENKNSLDEVIHLSAESSFGKREIIEQTMSLAYSMPTEKRLEFLEKIRPEISAHKIFRFSFLNISLVDEVEKVQEHFEIALKYSPGRQITYYALIKFYLRIKNYQSALHYSHLAYQLNPEIYRSKIIHALCLIFNNKVKESDEVIKDVPFDLYANNSLFVTAYTLIHRQDKIVTHLKKMIQIYPHRIEIYTQLGMLLSEMGLEEEAQQVFKESQKVTQEQLLKDMGKKVAE